VTARLLRFSKVLVGHVTGSLSLINVIASMFFAGVSGSCAADTSAIGSVLIPAMKKEGYSAEYSAAVTGASSTIGHIIPPSIPMIMIGVMQEMPIGGLFLAGAIPGLLLGFMLMGLSYLISVKRDYPREMTRSSLKEMIRAGLDGFLVLMMPVVVVGGIVFGVVTVTETGVLACAYALLLSFAYREMTLSTALRMIKETALGIGNLLLILAAASFFSWVVMNTGVGTQLVDLVTSISTNKYIVLTLLVFFLLIIGCALDVLATILIFVPVLFPLAEQVGIDPYHFAAVFVLCMGIALLTPPVGLILYMVTDMSGSTLVRVIKESIAFFGAQLLVLALVSYVPILTTWLPALAAK
jgi:tripartite ATP-independent transporter DctM subunit